MLYTYKVHEFIYLFVIYEMIEESVKRSEFFLKLKNIIVMYFQLKIIF